MLFAWVTGADQCDPGALSSRRERTQCLIVAAVDSSVFHSQTARVEVTVRQVGRRTSVDCRLRQVDHVEVELNAATRAAVGPPLAEKMVNWQTDRKARRTEVADCHGHIETVCSRSRCVKRTYTFIGYDWIRVWSKFSSHVNSVV